MHVTVCHCTDSQMSWDSRSACRFALAPSFRMLSGEINAYTKTAERGGKRVHSFCPDCGTPVHSSDPDQPNTYSPASAASTGAPKLPPARQIWCKSALAVSRDIAAVPAVESQYARAGDGLRS